MVRLDQSLSKPQQVLEIRPEGFCINLVEYPRFQTLQVFRKLSADHLRSVQSLKLRPNSKAMVFDNPQPLLNLFPVKYMDESLANIQHVKFILTA